MKFMSETTTFWVWIKSGLNRLRGWIVQSVLVWMIQPEKSIRTISIGGKEDQVDSA